MTATMNDYTSEKQALARAISEAGGVSAVAEALGITVQAVYKWDRAPVERCADLERLSRKKVRRVELRPDIFGSATSETRAA